MAQLDTSVTLINRWSKEWANRRSSLKMKIAAAAACAKKWEARSAAYATAGQFREADEAADQATDLYRLIDDLEVEGK